MLHVLIGGTHHLAGNKALGVFEQVEITAGVLHQVSRHFFHRAALAVKEDRQMGVACQVFFQQLLDLLKLLRGILVRVYGDQYS